MKSLQKTFCGTLLLLFFFNVSPAEASVRSDLASALSQLTSLISVLVDRQGQVASVSGVPALFELEVDSSGVSDGSSYNVPITGATSNVTPVFDGYAFSLNDNSKFTVTRNEAPHLFNLDEMSYEIAFRYDGSGQDWGELYRIHPSEIISVNSSGELTYRFTNSDDDQVNIVTSGSDLADGDWHHVAVVYDGSEIRLYVDGKMEESATASGSTHDVRHWDVSFGNPWDSPISADLYAFNIYGHALSANQVSNAASDFLGSSVDTGTEPDPSTGNEDTDTDDSPSDSETPDNIIESDAELAAALLSAKGGETFRLKEGDYTVFFYSGRDDHPQYTREVIITSYDKNRPAKITNLNIGGVKNITFDNLYFDYRFSAGDVDWSTVFIINEGTYNQTKNITIQNSVFDGDVARNTGDGTRDGFPIAKGLVVGGGTSITIKNNIFRKWHRAATFGATSHLIIKNNEVYDIRSDGFNFASVDDVLIEGNYIHDFRASLGTGDHLDMIQFWTNGTDDPSERVTIRGNWLLAQDGDWTQSIFMRNDVVDRGLAGLEMYYRDFVIENNVIHNAHTHGITLGETINGRISNNTILWNADAAGDPTNSVYNPGIGVSKGENVIVTKNVLPAKYKAGEGDEYTDNYIVQYTDSNASNYVGKQYKNALLGRNVTKGNLSVITNSPVDIGNYGSSLLGSSIVQVSVDDNDTVDIVESEDTQTVPVDENISTTDDVGTDNDQSDSGDANTNSADVSNSVTSGTANRIRTTDVLNVRTTAGGALIESVPHGTQGTMINTPKITQGAYTWIKVRFDNGIEGWVAEAFTSPVTTISSERRAAIIAQIQILMQLLAVLQAQLEARRANQ